MPDIQKPQYRKLRKAKKEAEKSYRKTVRLLCYEIDGYVCIHVDCPNKISDGRTTRFVGGVTHHHIVPRGQCGPDSLENSACLCPHCHDLAQSGDKRLTSHQWNLKILAPYRGTPKWRWDAAWDWHLSRVWRHGMVVRVQIEGGADVTLKGGDAQDVIDLLKGKGCEEGELAVPGTSIDLG